MDKNKKEIKLKYEDVTYGGVTENYIYFGTQEDLEGFDDIHLYNGEKSGYTLSHSTLEKIFPSKIINNSQEKPKKKYPDISYAGIVENFIYLGPQLNENNKLEFYLYNGEKSKTTVSHLTLEKLLKEKI